MQPKKQLKVQYIGIFEEIDSFYWPKMHFLKKGQKNRAWVDPPYLIWAMPERKRFFPIDVFPYVQPQNYIFYTFWSHAGRHIRQFQFVISNTGKRHCPYVLGKYKAHPKTDFSYENDKVSEILNSTKII